VIELNPFFLEDILNENHPSDCEINSNSLILILKLPKIRSNNLLATSFAFVVTKERVYLYNRDKKEFEELDGVDEIYTILDGEIDNLLKEVNKIQFEIDKLEESLYEEDIKEDFMQNWLFLKKKISFIEGLVKNSYIAFELFLKRVCTFYNKKFKKEALGDLLEHLKRVRDISIDGILKLDNLYNFYTAVVNEKMNKNIYIITMLSAIFMPLTLVSSFFGMNTGGLPLSNDPNGTLKAVIITLILEVIFIVPIFFISRFSIKKKKV